MFDIINYARDTGMKVTIESGEPGEYCRIELTDGRYTENKTIRNDDLKKAVSPDECIRVTLDRMAARIGSKQAEFYNNAHKSKKRADIEKLFNGI